VADIGSLQNPWGRRPHCSGPQSYRTLQLAVRSFGLESVFLTEGSIVRHLGVKADFTLEQVTKGESGSLFNLDNSWRWVVNDTPRPIYRQEWTGIDRTGWWMDPRAGLDRCGKSRHKPGFDPRTVQPVASRYADWDIPAPHYQKVFVQMCCSFVLGVGYFPTQRTKTPLPLRFNVNDHEIELWRSHYYKCAYCKQSVPNLFLEHEREGDLA
jgi:hypothetical protein